MRTYNFTYFFYNLLLNIKLMKWSNIMFVGLS